MNQEGVNEKERNEDRGEPFQTIPVIHEQLEISKKLVETGRVNISKTVSEHQELVDIPLMHEEISVEKVSINRYIESNNQPVRYEGDTMIIPVVKEVVVVERRLMLVEELWVTKRKVETRHTEQVTLKKEEVKIERKPVSGDI